MTIFDRIEAVGLERRQWHLWVLTMAVIVVLLSGMALLMFPAVFSNSVVLSGPTLRKSFFGFCALGVLMVGYLTDRQIVIEQLRKRLAAEEQKISRIRQEASVDLINSLPGLNHFRDRLAMNFRRAVSTEQPLSILLVNLKPSLDLVDTAEVITAFGDAAKAMIRKLRGDEAIYCFSSGVFGIVLPGLNVCGAQGVRDRLCDGLLDASGASERFLFDIKVLNYPEHVATAWEMEDIARSFLPEIQLPAGDTPNQVTGRAAVVR